MQVQCLLRLVIHFVPEDLQKLFFAAAYLYLGHVKLFGGGGLGFVFEIPESYEGLVFVAQLFYGFFQRKTFRKTFFAGGNGD